MKTDPFQSCDHCWVLQICWHIECSTFTASSFRIWNSSTGIPSPPWDLFKLPHDWATELNWNLDNPDLFSPKPQKMPNLFFYFISNVWSFSLVIFSSVQSLSRVWLFAAPWTVACQAPPSMEFSRQGYWTGLQFPSPRDVPDSGIKPRPMLMAGRHFTHWSPRTNSKIWHSN